MLVAAPPRYPAPEWFGLRSEEEKMSTIALSHKAAKLMRLCDLEGYKVQNFADFNADNDPYGEHDFGSFEVAGETFFWKIDYYDSPCEFGSEDPADPEKTTRVITIMFAAEY
jgi:hypothetical protein